MNRLQNRTFEMDLDPHIWGTSRRQNRDCSASSCHEVVPTSGQRLKTVPSVSAVLLRHRPRLWIRRASVCRMHKRMMILRLSAAHRRSGAYPDVGLPCGSEHRFRDHSQKRLSVLFYVDEILIYERCRNLIAEKRVITTVGDTAR